MLYPDIPNTKQRSHIIAQHIAVDDPLPDVLISPPPPTPNSKSIFAFWDTGLANLPPYLLRNILNWHRRFSPLGWTVYVLDNVPNSALNVANHIDTSSPSVVPDAFRNDNIKGEFPAQHTSDLIRFPLLLRYGGVYLDVGILQFGDLDWLWTHHIANPGSPYEFAGFCVGDSDPPEINVSIMNFSMMCTANNPLVLRGHRILLELWKGRNETKGMHAHPLVAHVPLMKVPRQRGTVSDGTATAGNAWITDEGMTDYIIQVQAMGAAQRWVDDEEGWDGPRYVREHTWLYPAATGSFAPHRLTNWDGKRQYELMSLTLHELGREDEKETENEDQKLARQIVHETVGHSWCLKLGNGPTSKYFGDDTMGMFWKRNEGSDCKEGTYAGWLRWAEVNLVQVTPPTPVKVPVYEATTRGKIPI